jgi:hypothetical protein
MFEASLRPFICIAVVDRRRPKARFVDHRSILLSELAKRHSHHQEYREATVLRLGSHPNSVKSNYVDPWCAA